MASMMTSTAVKQAAGIEPFAAADDLVWLSSLGE